MAVVVLTPTPISRLGIDPELVDTAASADGHQFTNTGREFIWVDNGSASPITVTLDIKETVDGQPVTDPTVTVAAGVAKMIGPFPTGVYNDDCGKVNFTVSLATTVTVAALRLTQEI